MKTRQVAAVRRRHCPRCDGPLTDPARSPLGFSHCMACRVGWRVDETSLGEYVVNRSHDPRFTGIRGQAGTKRPPQGGGGSTLPPIVRRPPGPPAPGVRTIPDPRYEPQQE
jgi:hypothetical protein